jgi:4-hydroxy-3-methylbut-2-enyl diphosphate reductase
MRGFETIKSAYEEKTVLEAPVSEVTDGGLVVIVDNVRVFIPKSLTGKPASFDFASLKNEVIQFNVIEFSVIRGRKKIIGSMKTIENEKRKAARKEFWENVNVGDKFEGVVKSLTTFGAFVDLGYVDGLLHITELSWKKIGHPSEVVNVGDLITVYVKAIDAEAKKISLGYKDPDSDPFVLFTNNNKVEDVVKVKIVSLMPFGAFANITDGVDGLIHISQLSNKRVNKPADVVSVGDEVEAQIVDINLETRKIGLSMKALIEEPEQEVAEEEIAEHVVEEAAE